MTHHSHNQNIERYTTKTSTIYKKNVHDPKDAKTLLKPGSQNKKLGFKINTGMWTNKRLYSLTLEERTTCPRSCHHWEDCYGNNMPFAHRFKHGKDLISKLEVEITELMKKHKHGVVIRLHVLGDFYSLSYVKFWRKMLIRYPKLSIFGYTARDDNIGEVIKELNARYPDQCVIRFSRNEKFDDTNRYAADEAMMIGAFTCPEQTGKVKNCANCGLCWSVNKTVRFLTH